jgi:hypothetical protein
MNYEMVEFSPPRLVRPGPWRTCLGRRRRPPLADRFPDAVMLALIQAVLEIGPGGRPADDDGDGENQGEREGVARRRCRCDDRNDATSRST